MFSKCNSRLLLSDRSIFDAGRYYYSGPIEQVLPQLVDAPLCSAHMARSDAQRPDVAPLPSRTK